MSAQEKQITPEQMRTVRVFVKGLGQKIPSSWFGERIDTSAKFDQAYYRFFIKKN